MSLSKAKDIAAFSFLQYSPKKSGALSDQGKSLLGSIKNGRIDLFEEVILKAQEENFFDFLDSSTTLVPVPKSNKFNPELKLPIWPSLSICKKLIELGVGRDISTLLKREISVPKSAFQRPEDRPTVKIHYDSISCGNEDPTIEKIVIVDDVLTRGATTVACFLRIQEKFPNIPIEVFTLFKTESFDVIDSIYLKIQSTIKYYSSGKTFVTKD